MCKETSRILCGTMWTDGKLITVWLGVYKLNGKIEPHFSASHYKYKTIKREQITNWAPPFRLSSGNTAKREERAVQIWHSVFHPIEPSVQTIKIQLPPVEGSGENKTVTPRGTKTRLLERDTYLNSVQNLWMLRWEVLNGQERHLVRKESGFSLHGWSGKWYLVAAIVVLKKILESYPE